MLTYIDNNTSITLDGMSIPKDGGNRHYSEFLELLAAGEAELVQPTVSEEVLASQIRIERDNLISATDYKAMPDYPIDADKKASLLIYRQALRDITKQSTFPISVIWPVLSV